jgi:hypothetical protein
MADEIKITKGSEVRKADYRIDILLDRGSPHAMFGRRNFARGTDATVKIASQSCKTEAIFAVATGRLPNCQKGAKSDCRVATLAGRRRRDGSRRQGRCTGWALLYQICNRWSQTRQVFQQVEPEWGAEREQTGCKENTEQVPPELAKPGIKPARPLWIIPTRYETRWHQRKTSFFNVIL